MDKPIVFTLVICLLSCTQEGVNEDEHNATLQQTPESTADQMSEESSDTLLQRRVKSAFDNDVAPAELEEWVGLPAKLNTIADPDEFLMLDRLKISPDLEKHEPLPARHTVQDIIFWIRPVDIQPVKIIGIIWDKEGKKHLFWGRIHDR